MKLLYKLSILLFLLPVISAAQSNYKAGYVVTLNGDTVKGFIDYQAWDSNPTDIYFKTSIADHDRKTYGMSTISFFSIDRVAAYKKYTVNISTDITNPAQVGEGRDTSSRTSEVFLKVLQVGKNLTLYSYADNIKRRFYVGEAPDYTPTELVYRLYYDNSRTVNENTYQKQLFALANKYNAVDDKLNRAFQDANYNDVDLLGIVSRINNVSKAEVAKNYSAHGKISWYVSAALNAGNTTSDATSSYTAAGGIPYTSYLPGAAFGLDFVPDPNGGKAEFRIGISINPIRFNALYQLKVSPNIGAQASYNQLDIALTPTVIYNLYNAENFKFYLGIGIALNDFTYSNPYFQSQNMSSPNPFFPVEPYDFSTFDTSFLFRAGFRIHKNWEIYVNYSTPAVASHSGYFALTESNRQVGVSYFFGL